MNQDEDVPARVTRGALRRRSVDQEATPQKPTGTAVSGTPKKTNSTTKRVTALNAIQESETGRPSTPIVGRATRRRMSETIDTPTSLPNKLVQNLKEAESTSTEPGRRSRNSSLTEENLNELNATYEGNNATLTTRSRTPARLRASLEALTSVGSPQPVTGVRRSTRRNSITSDDGNSSVQSLPVTTSKLGVRALKDDTIIEEEDRDDRAESVSSDTSARQTRAQSALSTVSLSATSPRSSPVSPVLGVKSESTPPRVSKTPRVAITPLSLSKMSPRSKNVSFSEDSKQDDHQSSLPKTPTSVSKEMFVLVEDLRNSEQKGGIPHAITAVNASPKMAESEKKIKSVNASPKRETEGSEKQLQNETDVSVSKDKMNDSNTSMIGDKDKMNDSTTSMIAVENGEPAEKAITANDVSGIVVLDSSVKDTTDTTVMEGIDTMNNSSSTANQSLSEGNKFSNSWSQSVRRSATKGIDEYSIRKQEEQERLEEQKATQHTASLDSSLKSCSPVTKQTSPKVKEEESTFEEQEDEEEETRPRNEFADDEALEMEDYQSCDSLDSELRKEMEENQIPEQGEDLGSEDTEENDEPEDDEEDGNDSWIVSDGDEIEPMEEDELLQSSNDDEASMAKDDKAKSDSKQPKLATRRRRILDPGTDSDEEKASSPAKSPKRDTENLRRSATPALRVENDNLTPTKQTNVTENRDDEVEKTVEKTTPNAKITPVKTSVDQEKMDTSLVVPTTPTVGEKSPKKVVLKSPAPTTMDNTKEVDDEKQAISVSVEEQETKDCSMVMFEDDDKNEATEQENNKEEIENDDTSVLSSSLSKSPKKAINSRKSLPASATNITETQAVVAGARKSLPASAKLLLSAGNENEKSDGNEMKNEELSEPNESNGNMEEIVDLEENLEAEPASSPDKKEKTHNESVTVEVSLDQPVAEQTDTGRKSMPPVSLISAQFYIGAAKKRNTIGGDMKAVTSTPKEKISTEKMKKDKNEPVEKKKGTKDGTSVVPNPFALAKGGKVKSRVSLDSGVEAATGQQQPQAAKKVRLSLPPKLREEDASSQMEEPTVNQQPEPMEVDEAPDEEENGVVNEEEAVQQTDDETSEDDDESVSVQEVEPSDGKQRIKAPKPKAKALEDYDLANILVRCNEFVREDKERKKQLASALRKKKEEKKKQRELEKQQELEAAKIAAANALAANKDDPNSTNDSAGQGEESLKKKKKRKPKKVNYLLEELGETKKERLEQALRRKLEVIERRKQRKKDRLLEKKKVQDKENGHDEENVATVAASGIGAKLQKLKKNKKMKQGKDKSKEPPVQVALSAYAVFNQIPTNQQEPAVTSAPVEEAKQMKSDELPVEKKQQQLKVAESESATKIKTKTVESTEEVPKESPNAKKKKVLVAQPEETSVTDDIKKDILPALHSAASNGMPDGGGKMSKKQKKKLATTTESANGESELQNEMIKVIAQPAETSAKVEKSKEKKMKEQVTEFTLNEANSGATVSKQKKSKKIKQSEPAEEEKLSSAIDEHHAVVETTSNVKKRNKKLASQTISDVQQEHPKPTEVVPAKKRKRDQQGENSSVASTPRPAKHTKLRVLQRIESGGFLEESVTPDKLRMKRNFGFDERQATPAKQLGFRVSSMLPTGQDELRDLAISSKKSTKDGRKPSSKFGDLVTTERNTSLPLPVWTSSGVFLESAIDGGDSEKKKPQKSKPISSTASDSGFIQIKTQAKADFNLKKLRTGPAAEKPHRVDPATTGQSVLNFKRQQLLEMTAHLRDKKKSHRV